MNFRLLFYIGCFASLISSVTPCFIQCMERSRAVSGSQLLETSPMDIDPSIFGEVDQIVGRLTDPAESEVVSVAIGFPVNNIQELGVAIQTLIQLSQNQSPQAKSMSQKFASKIATDIERIYKQNPQTVTEFIQQNRDKLNPELQNIFDICLGRCNGKMHRFANCHACSVYTSVALFSFVIYFVLKEFYL
ncbi:MAG: prephenate dehydrogenase dimerization domain-containing protein [bacterium]